MDLMDFIHLRSPQFGNSQHFPYFCSMYIIKTITYTLSFLFCFVSCKTKQETLVIPEPGTLEQIEQRGVLNVCCYYNTTDYYVYKGIPKGFHYELVKNFADYLGVKLNIEINTNIDESIQRLNDNKYDLIAISLSVTDARKENVRFCLPLFTTSQVLVQYKSDTLLQSIEDLKNKEIFLQEGTSPTRFLQHLNDSLQLNLKITELEDVTFEDILLKIENGEIPYTVIDKNIAQIASQYMKHIDYSLQLSPENPVAWAITKKATLLNEEINNWLGAIKKSGTLNVLYNRYYKNSYITSLHNSKYYKLKNGVISSFDPIIKKEAQAIGWDWRLLAAVIYQESGFDPEATSHLGAVGLMQVMPETSLELGFEAYEEPQDNIHVGAYYLKYLENKFNKFELDTLEQIKFTLAAYNAGLGHVLDAIRLAESYGKNPKVWNNNVDYFILHKSQPEIYRDSVARSGYCDGKQTFNFVNNIIENYTHYKNTIKK